MPLTLEQAVDVLAPMLERYPRRGGPTPKALHLLRSQISTDSTQYKRIAEIVLGTQLDSKPANSSAMNLAEEVSREFGWEVTFTERGELGAYLLSCLIRLGYYLPRKISGVGYVLHVRKKELLNFPERDPYTQHEQFPLWESGTDDGFRKLVKPAHPQLERTEWNPEATNFKGHMDHVFDDPEARARHPTSLWVSAAHALEGVAYSINDEMLDLVNRVWGDKTKQPLKTIDAIERKYKRCLAKYTEEHPRKGIWKDIPRKADRTVKYLHKQRKKGDREQNKETAFITADQLQKVKDHWATFMALHNHKEAIAAEHNEFKSVVKRTNELVDKPFYHRCFLDYRGRLYLSRSIVNYQKGDLCRGLIQFKEGKTIQKRALSYLWIHLANTYGAKGHPKTLEKEGKKLRDKALRYAANPFGTYNQWKSIAGDKWMFIRACFELRDRLKNPNHASHLICEIDQSQSALQHISLIAGDKDFSHKCNMGSEYHDTYAAIAANVTELDDCSDKNLKRKLVKDALVPWTYGGEEWTGFKAYCKRQYDCKYLKTKNPSELYAIAKGVLDECRSYLGPFEDYKKDVMRWAEKEWDKDNNPPRVAWTVPTGFVVWYYHAPTVDDRPTMKRQADTEKAVRDARLTLKKALEWNTKELKAKVLRIQKEKCKREALKAAPPNYVHSMDGAVAQMVLATAQSKKINLVTVHDAVGTHLDDVEAVAKIFRRCLADIYRVWVPPFIEAEKLRYISDPELVQFLRDVHESEVLIT